MPLLLFVGFIIICITISHAVSHNSKIENATSDDFWKREQDGNFVRKQPTDDLIRIVLDDSLPYETDCDEELAPIMSKINSLKEKEIINLTGITNTELKLRYGLPNLDYLTECDGNFTNLAIYLDKWSEYLISHNRTKDALTVLEFAVDCGVDIGNIYINLANIYISQNQSHKIKSLIQKCETLNSLTGKLTANKLRETIKIS